MSKKEIEYVKVKVLRGFQTHEVGSIIDLEKNRLHHLLARKMVALYEGVKVSSNRSVGLDSSEKKVVKRDK